MLSDCFCVIKTPAVVFDVKRDLGAFVDRFESDGAERRFAGGAPFIGRFNAVVDAVAENVVERAGHFLALARACSLLDRLDVLRRHHPELRVRLIEGAGHWVMYEAADTFNATFLDLLHTPR